MAVRATQLEALASRTPAGTAQVSDSVEPWLEAWAATAQLASTATATAATVLARVPSPTAYAFVEAAGEPVAFARGVAYGGWLGIDHLAAAPAWQQPDTGRALAATLATWGERHGAEQAYLQVDDGDAAQVTLARDVGGRAVFSYRFMTAPARVPR